MKFNYLSKWIIFTVLLSVFFLVILDADNVVEARGVKRTYSEMQAVQDTTEEDTTVSKESTVDATNMRWSDIMDKFGLDIARDIAALLDHAHDIVDKHTKEAEFEAMNDVLETLKESFFMTLKPLENAKVKPSGSLEPSTVSELFDVMQTHFRDILMSHDNLTKSSIQPFVSHYVGPFFASIKELYAKGYSLGLSLNWSMIYILAPFLKNVPTDIFSRSSFQEILSVPGMLKQALYDMLEQLFSGDLAHVIRMILAFMQTIDWQRMMGNSEKVEL